MKAKLLHKIHGYKQTICQKVANPGNRYQANKLEEKKLKAKRSMKKVKGQLKKLEESAWENLTRLQELRTVKSAPPHR